MNIDKDLFYLKRSIKRRQNPGRPPLKKPNQIDIIIAPLIELIKDRAKKY